MSKQSYYIIGLPGAGKTQLLNEIRKVKKDILGIDLDDNIALNYNFKYSKEFNIHEVFEHSSHLEFRNLERELLKSISTGDYQLIACGGGTPCYFDNMDYMLNTGTVLWLQTPIKTIIDRVAQSHRPIPILGVDDGNPETKDLMTNLLEKRIPFYKRAHFHQNEKEMLEYLKQTLKI